MQSYMSTQWESNILWYFTKTIKVVEHSIFYEILDFYGHNSFQFFLQFFLFVVLTFKTAKFRNQISLEQYTYILKIRSRWSINNSFSVFLFICLCGIETEKEKETLQKEYNWCQRVCISIHSQKCVTLFFLLINKKNIRGFEPFKIWVVK